MNEAHQDLLNSPTRPIRRRNRWRYWRRLLLGLVLAATLIALFYTEEDLRGWIAWRKHVSGHALTSDKLDFSAFIPPPVPDDHNLCLCPLLRPILQLHMVNGQAVWTDTNGLARVQALNARMSVSYNLPEITNGLAGWQAYYRSLTNLSGLAWTNSPAEDVLLALRRFDPELAELRQAAATRPLDRWPLDYGTDSPWEIPFPHLARVKQICLLLQLRATAGLAAGDAAGACSDLQLGFRLAQSLRAEPFLISQVVRAVCCHLLLEPLAEGLERHQFSDTQLLALQHELQTVDLLSGWELGSLSERALVGAWTKPGLKQMFEWAGQFGLDRAAGPFDLFARYIRLAPQGWVYQNRLSLCRRFDECLVPAVDLTTRTVRQPSARTAARPPSNPGSILVLFLFQVDRKIFGDAYHGLTRVAYAQARTDEALIACALERYRLAHGGYPQTLEALVPQFLDQRPHDLLNGQPLHYRLNHEGSPVLYSVGWNRTDDGGVVARSTDGTQGGAILRYHGAKIDLEQGDWVWP